MIIAKKCVFGGLLSFKQPFVNAILFYPKILIFGQVMRQTQKLTIIPIYGHTFLGHNLVIFGQL